MSNLSFNLVLLTLNAADVADDFLDALHEQTWQANKLLILDSCSEDETRSVFARNGAEVLLVEKSEFDHGSTRQRGVAYGCPGADILVFMTQDALLAHKSSLENLVRAFEDEMIGAAYGRQLPHRRARPIEAHARLFNYPPQSQVKALSDRNKLGVKTCFMSNSFAAYRCSALQQVRGFPSDNIVSEDTYVAAKMLKEGWRINYCADAAVYHSHNYTIAQEFQRYFDLGVFHSREPWIRKLFGQAEGEGKKFVLSQMAFLIKGRAFLIPSALLRTVFKYLGFRLGFCEAYLPNRVKIWLSMQKCFWL